MVVESSYPDSVSLVRPPNTTSPNTLAALPSSQYATALSLVSGKNDFLDVSSRTLWIVLLNDESGEPTSDAIPTPKPAVWVRGLPERNVL